VGELVEINGCVDGDLEKKLIEGVKVSTCSDTYRRTRVAECTGGGGTIDRGDSWWIREGQGLIITWTKKIARGRTSEGHHQDVATGHELDVHRLPLSSRVCGPPYLTSASLIIDMSRIRKRNDGISEDNRCQGQNESRESATRKHWNKTFAARYTEVKRGGSELVERWARQQIKCVEG
jgi:hypothetical protein